MKPQRVNFDVFGDREIASSRLRGWMIADQLRATGHHATVNGPLNVEVQVFQKRRDSKRLQTAKANGARIVYDFDDNYLLDNVGSKDDILAFMNQADVVTVGSRDLFECASRYHDHVILFENPLDVLPNSGAKAEYSWSGHLGWFGAPENQGIVDALGLRERVKTVTADGDIPWSLDTIDRVLTQFDLVVIPVEINASTLAKNANRLLKCVALGVPVLASKTPEHERIIAEFGLPDWLLVKSDADWNMQIDEVRSRYAELPPKLVRARALAFERYGISPITEKWLREILHDPSSITLVNNAPGRHTLSDVDVIVLGEDVPSLLDDSLKSLRLAEFDYHSITVISPVPIEHREHQDKFQTVEFIDQHEDFFEIYDAFAQLLGSRAGVMTLVVQAGVEVQRGLFNEIDSLDPGVIHLFRGQKKGNGIVLMANPPATFDHLISHPYRPSAFLLPNRAYASSAGLQSRFGPLAIWELLVALLGRKHIPIHAVTTPLIVIAPELAARTPMQSYSDFVRATAPGIQKDLPSLHNEWERLIFTLHGAVIEEHADLIRHYQSTIIPRLSIEFMRANGRPSDQQREQQRSNLMLAQLRGKGLEEQPQLFRLPSGKIYLIEAGMKRHVPSLLIVHALQRLFETVAASEHDLEAYEEGPPVDILSDETGHRYLIAGGMRYPVRGLPVPRPASSEHLTCFPEFNSTLDLAPGVNQSHGEKSIRLDSTPLETMAPLETSAGSSLKAPNVPISSTSVLSPTSTVNEAETRKMTEDSFVIIQHADSWVGQAELGATRPYRPTFGTTPFINETHQRLLEAPLKPDSVVIDIGIPGSLRREDAAKLYELAYFGKGDVLEFGCARGLSTAIITQAVYDAGRNARVVSFDSKPRMIERTRANLGVLNLREWVELVEGDAVMIGRSLIDQGRTFGFVFVDHSPAYGDVLAVCRLLPSLVNDGGFVLFHDFNDRRNRDQANSDYGVYWGVVDGLPAPPFAFYGAFGCAGLYRQDTATEERIGDRSPSLLGA